MELNLQGRLILITGAGSGIGRATAIVASQMGANVVLLDVNAEGIRETFSSLSGDGHAYRVLDLTDTDALVGAVKEIVAKNGLINGLVHCAGISSRKPINVLKKEGFAKLMDVNLYSFIELVKLMSKRSVLADGGSIVVMSSISSIKGYKAKSEYCVSKAAIDAFVRCAALELASRKIRINSVMPGVVLTPLGMKSREIAAMAGATIDEPPLGPTEPSEVANLIAFLLSDATKTITGTSIVIDGGLCI